MKGFEINYDGEIVKIAIDDTKLTIIDINDVNGLGTVYIASVEYDTQIQNIWHHHSPIKLGDKFEIKMIDIDYISEPIESKIDKNIKQPISKLEHFLQIERYLKEKGLL